MSGWIFLREKTQSKKPPSSWPLRLRFNWLSKITRAHPSVPPQSGNPGEEAATCTWWRALRGPDAAVRPLLYCSTNAFSLCWCGLVHHLYVKPMWEGSTLQSRASEMWSKWEAGCSSHSETRSHVHNMVISCYLTPQNLPHSSSGRLFD